MSTFMLRSLVSSSKNPSNILTKLRHIGTSGSLHKSIVPKSYNKKDSRKLPMTWKSLAISSIIGSAFLMYMNHLRQEKDKAIARERKRQLGKAKIGGTFELTDTDGKLVKSDDLMGQWILIYFGFTHCPDICPDEIDKMITVVNRLEKEHNFNIQPVFISVDPLRDTPAIIKKYLKEFSDKIIGLTGSLKQIEDVCRNYRVYYNNGPKDIEEDYIVDHTIITYLIDPDGSFVDYYGQTHEVESTINSILINKLKYDNLNDDDKKPNWFSVKGLL